MTNAVPKLTLLRHRGEGDISEPADIALGRIATDDELEALYRVPGRWSFLIRDPSQAIAGKGDGDTQLECLDAVLCAVAGYAIEFSTIDHRQPCDVLGKRLAPIAVAARGISNALTAE